jgi:hypothetical protein
VAPDDSLMAVRVDARGSSWRGGSPVRVVEGPYLSGSSRSSRNYCAKARFGVASERRPNRFPSVLLHPNQKSERFPDSEFSCVTSSRAFRGSGPAAAEPSGLNSKMTSFFGS